MSELWLKWIYSKLNILIFGTSNLSKVQTVKYIVSTRYETYSKNFDLILEIFFVSIGVFFLIQSSVNSVYKDKLLLNTCISS